MVLFSSVLISLLAALWVWLVGRKQSGGRPWFTVLAMLILLVLPLMGLFPGYDWEVERMADRVGGDSIITISQGWQSFEDEGVIGGSSGLSALLWLWLSGSVVMLVRMLVGRCRLRRWVMDSVPVRENVRQEWQEDIRECLEMLSLRRAADVRVKEGIRSPVVAGIRRPVILMPAGSESWSVETRRMALLHELAHVKRRDLWLRLVADAACALHWYNPLVWWMRGKLISQCEYACDARVVAAGVDKKGYAEALCDVVEWAMAEAQPCRVEPQGVVGMAGDASLSSRVDRMFIEGRAGVPYFSVVVAMLTVTAGLGFSLIRPVGSPSAPAIHVFGSEAKSMWSEVEVRHSANPFPGNRGEE